MHKESVLLLSHDLAVREQWLRVGADPWRFDSVNTIEQALQWVDQYKGMVLVDAAMVDLDNPTWHLLFSRTIVLVGSTAPNDIEGQKMIVAGAKGYFHTYSSISIMHSMLRHVLSGHIWIGQSLLSRLLSQVSAVLQSESNTWQDGLTPREIEIAQRVALGHSNQLIADDLQISERTVRAHLSAVFEKLQVSDRLMLSLMVHGVNIKNTV